MDALGDAIPKPLEVRSRKVNGREKVRCIQHKLGEKKNGSALERAHTHETPPPLKGFVTHRHIHTHTVFFKAFFADVVARLIRDDLRLLSPPIEVVEGDGIRDEPGDPIRENELGLL